MEATDLQLILRVLFLLMKSLNTLLDPQKPLRLKSILIFIIIVHFYVLILDIVSIKNLVYIWIVMNTLFEWVELIKYYTIFIHDKMPIGLEMVMRILILFHY